MNMVFDFNPICIAYLVVYGYAHHKNHVQSRMGDEF